MRLKLIGVGFLILILCFSLSSVVLAESEGQFGQVTADAVRLREEPGTDTDILAEIPINARVQILGEKDGWYRVLYQDTIGYLRQDYVFTSSTGSRAAYVTEDGVKLRGGPGQTSYVVTELTAGLGVKIKQMVGDWYFVVAGDNVGYVHRSYLIMTRATNTASNMLKVGMEGQEVRKMQSNLADRGFMSRSDVTGSYGAITRTAVQEFQEACEFEQADGIAGAETLSALYDNNNKVTKKDAIKNQLKGRVELLDWFKGGSDFLYRYSKFTIIDVRTGLSFKARRFGGWYHADTEPLTAQDTAILKKIVGNWTWDRRPIWISFNGRVIAASMHSMPHMDNPTKSNNYPGHFCVHLYNSKVHETSRACPRHQSCVKQAYNAGR